MGPVHHAVADYRDHIYGCTNHLQAFQHPRMGAPYDLSKPLINLSAFSGSFSQLFCLQAIDPLFLGFLFYSPSTRHLLIVHSSPDVGITSLQWFPSKASKSWVRQAKGDSFWPDCPSLDPFVSTLFFFYDWQTQFCRCSWNLVWMPASFLN